VVMALVTFFQPEKPFDLQPLVYMLIVVVITSVIDQVIDSFITPRIMARTLKVHPAAVLVTALVAANLLGILGVVIAAPFLATFTLLGRYTMRKMFDREPWPEAETEPPPPATSEMITRIKHFFQTRFGKTTQEETINPKENTNEQQSKRTKNRNDR